MFHTACYALVFIIFYQFINHLALVLVSVKLHQPIHEAQIYFVFLSVGNPKTVLKGGYSGWRGESSFASFGLCVGLCGLQMCMTAKGWLI